DRCWWTQKGPVAVGDGLAATVVKAHQERMSRPIGEVQHVHLTEVGRTVVHGAWRWSRRLVEVMSDSRRWEFGRSRERAKVLCLVEAVVAAREQRAGASRH